MGQSMSNYWEQLDNPTGTTLTKPDPLDEFLAYLELFANVKIELQELGVDDFRFRQCPVGRLWLAYVKNESLPYSNLREPSKTMDVHHAEFVEYAFTSKSLGRGWTVFIAVAPEIKTLCWYLGGRYFWDEDLLYWRYDVGEYGAISDARPLRDDEV